MSNILKLSDELLIKHVREKNKEAFAEIIKRYQDKLLRYASYLVNDEDKAADIVQEAFIKSYINLNGYDIKRKFSSWIYRITHNEAMNYLNKHKKEFPLLENNGEDSGIDLEDDLVKKELQAHAHYCLKQIDIIYKEPLSLYFIEGKSYDEIAEILRIPIGTVGTRINRAKALMKKICKI